jgi:hypothetical protein
MQCVGSRLAISMLYAGEPAKITSERYRYEPVGEESGEEDDS